MTTEARRTSWLRYEQSEKGRATRARYEASDEGKASHARRDANYRATPAGRAIHNEGNARWRDNRIIARLERLIGEGYGA